MRAIRESPLRGCTLSVGWVWEFPSYVVGEGLCSSRNKSKQHGRGWNPSPTLGCALSANRPRVDCENAGRRGRRALRVVLEFSSLAVGEGLRALPQQIKTTRERMEPLPYNGLCVVRGLVWECGRFVNRPYGVVRCPRVGCGNFHHMS